MATLSDYRQPPQGSGKDGDAQQFYAGGSEHSGQMIEGPPRKKPNPEDIAKDVFEAAKKYKASSILVQCTLWFLANGFVNFITKLFGLTEACAYSTFTLEVVP